MRLPKWYGEFQKSLAYRVRLCLKIYDWKNGRMERAGGRKGVLMYNGLTTKQIDKNDAQLSKCIADYNSQCESH